MEEEKATAENAKENPDIFGQEFSKHYDAVKEKISKFLQNKEPDTLIIKGHLLCEYYLNQLLVIVNQNDFDKKTWSEKNEKLFQLKIISDDSHKKLVQLNKLRNTLGHELEYVLSESDVDKIGFIFGKGYIIDKYDIKNKKELLEKYISEIVIDIALDLMVKIYNLKKEEV